MNPNALLLRSMSVPAAATTSRACGPPTATTDHCSVTLVQYTCRSGPLGLEPLLEAIQHRGGAAGRGGHDVSVVGQAHRDAVVEHHPVEPEHQAVPDRPDGQVRHAVRVHPIQEHARVGPAHVDLAQCARVEHAHARAHRAALASDRRVHVLAVPREVARALPLADVLEDGAVRFVPVVDRRHADRVEQRPAVDAGQRRERDRRVRRPGVRRALRAGCPAEQPVHDLGGQDAAGASLVDRGADVGRTLHVLGARQSARHGVRDVGDRLVALGLDVLLGIVAVVDHPDRERRRHVAGGRARRRAATRGRCRRARSTPWRRRRSARSPIAACELDASGSSRR